MIRDAVLSECRKYRYSLYRQWADTDDLPVLWVMLNPSTADANVDDRTIRRCISFSQEWGYGAMWIGNIYAYRSTDPRVLWTMGALEARGSGNLHHLKRMAKLSARTVCAWGTSGLATVEMLDLIRSPGGLWCLGMTKHGYPRHPLYVRGGTPLVEFHQSKRGLSWTN